MAFFDGDAVLKLLDVFVQFDLRQRRNQHSIIVFVDIANDVEITLWEYLMESIKTSAIDRDLVINFCALH